MAIAPRDGEHPLATKGRKLHSELALAWTLAAFPNICLAILEFVRGEYLPGGVGFALLLLFLNFAVQHLRWSR